jgi:CBS domain-containing protein
MSVAPHQDGRPAQRVAGAGAPLGGRDVIGDSVHGEDSSLVRKASPVFRRNVVNFAFTTFIVVGSAASARDTCPVRDHLCTDNTTGGGTMKVRDALNINVARIQLGTKVSQAADMFAYTGVSDLAVVDAAGEFVGVLSEGDLIRAVLPRLAEVIEGAAHLGDGYAIVEERGHEMAEKTIDALVIRSPLTLKLDDDLHRAAATMTAQHIRRLPVVEDGKLIGSVSRADVCRAVFR